MENTTVIRVRYKETDQMGIVYNGNYFTWFEIGRTELLRSMGMTYVELEDRGILIAVIEANCKYIKPAKYDDEIIIKTKLVKLTGVRSEFEYSIFEKDENVLLAKGYTIHAFVDKNIRPINIKKKHKDIWELLGDKI
ncbi:acyl-CoA thioesterase [Schnuerera sp. xch1]|uniref:acyl-CoA thioesterase n=1 Tax=Schnuerera sp. xch1 TaxID=2874283 RepID=UPI001CBE4A43|nr:thioesterase family protein [Schnuerera sp. xch1]MBZ2175652.1 acyl-CoA thioesterase [Schnuerera sp. xch1]